MLDTLNIGEVNLKQFWARKTFVYIACSACERLPHPEPDHESRGATVSAAK